MTVPGSEKHQSNALVCNSKNKFDHLPIKKRRFLYRSPSPPSRNPSPDDEQRSVSLKSELDILSVDKAAAQADMKSVEDFSGISMLADAAACPNSLGRDYGDADDGSGIEELSVNEGPVEVSTNSEAQSFSKGLVKEEPLNTRDISVNEGPIEVSTNSEAQSFSMRVVKEELANTPDTSVGGALSCVTAALAGEYASVSTDCTSVKVENIEKSIKEPFHEDSKPAVSSDVSSTRYEGTVGSQKNRDDRLHWDLNVVMDAWEEPSDYEDSHISDRVAQGSGIVAGCPENRNSSENHDLNEPESSLCDDKKESLHHESSKSLDQTSQGNTRNLVGHSNHKNQNQSDGMHNNAFVLSDKFGDRNTSVQPLVSKYVNEMPTEKTVISEPTGESTDMSPLFRDRKNLSVPDRDRDLVSVGDAVTRNTSVPVIDTQVKLTAQSSLDIDDELSVKPLVADKPFDGIRRNLKNDVNDSQYEDGELVLEEYDVVNEKTDHVDNVFVDKSSCVVTGTDHHYSESGQIRRMSQRNSYNDGIISPSGEVADELCHDSAMPITDDNDYGKDGNLLKPVHSRDENMEGPSSREMIESNKLPSATEVRARDDCHGTGRICNLATNRPDSEGTNSRTWYRRGFLSQSIGPVGRDMYFREDQARNRSKPGYSYTQYSERSRYSRPVYPRVHNDSSWNGSSDVHRGLKRNYSPTYHTMVNAADGDGTEGKKDRDGTLNNGSYISHDESIADRTTSRGRFQRYDREMDHGAGRGRFQSNPPARRDKSFSPNGRRGYQLLQHSRSKSPSRSSTRSPDPRASPYLRRTSRSPSFRPEARMTRMRSPHRFRPFQRDHVSPTPPRWISNRKDEPGHFSYKRYSPDRGRFPDSARDSKHDVHYRENPGRFSEMEGNGRPHRSQENFENRRGQFGIANRPSRDNDDSFDSRNRNEDTPRRFKREGSFIYERDRRSAWSLPTDSPRNMESPEARRPIYPGRFNQMNERRHYNNDAYRPAPKSSRDNDASDSHMDDPPTRQSDDQHFDSSEQEKKPGEASESMDVEAPAEK